MKVITKSQDYHACQTSLPFSSWPHTMGTGVRDRTECKIVFHPSINWATRGSLPTQVQIRLRSAVSRNRSEQALHHSFSSLVLRGHLGHTWRVEGEVGPCLKLQCLVRHYTDAKDLRAHRAAGGEYTRGPHEPFGSLGFHRIRFCVSLVTGPRRLYRFAARDGLLGRALRHRPCRAA